jgi:hypothetical protein
MPSARTQSQHEPRIFDEKETELVERTLATVGEMAASDALVMRGLLSRLRDLADVLWATPSLRQAHVLGGRARDDKTLVNHLIQIDGLDGELSLPLKATLSRSFLLAKIQFLRACVKSTSSLIGRSPAIRPLSLDLREELAQAIYTQLAEELLLALLRSTLVAARIKQRAAEQLVMVWDNAELEIDDFCPLLESAWHARNRVTAGLGSLLGTSEYFRLVGENCPPQFLDFFARDEVSLPEKQAFEEFLFGVTFEELSELRRAMREEGRDHATVDWASQILHRNIEAACDSDEIDPMALYRSYNRRQLAADFRIVAGSEGPERTAEAYMLIFLLDQQAG